MDKRILLATKSMSDDSEAALRAILDHLGNRGLRKPKLTIFDGALGLDRHFSRYDSVEPSSPAELKTSGTSMHMHCEAAHRMDRG